MHSHKQLPTCICSICNRTFSSCCFQALSSQALSCGCSVQASCIHARDEGVTGFEKKLLAWSPVGISLLPLGHIPSWGSQTPLAPAACLLSGSTLKWSFPASAAPEFGLNFWNLWRGSVHKLSRKRDWLRVRSMAGVSNFQVSSVLM